MVSKVEGNIISFSVIKLLAKSKEIALIYLTAYLISIIREVAFEIVCCIL